MMKTKYCLWVLLLMILSMPLVANAQCADIFKQGETLMKARKYKSAISYFQKAKKCDKNLAKKCDENINECRRYIAKDDSKRQISYVITLDEETLDFDSEETSAKAVKVTSEAEWACTSDADWCNVTKKNENSLSVNCEVNSTTSDRTATIRVNNGKETQNIHVIQKGMEPVLDIVPNLPIEFGKEGVEYHEIPLNTTMSYQVESKPEWVTIFRQDADMIAIKVEPLKRTEKDREGIFSIVSLEGNKKDYVVIKQYKKLQQKTVSEDNDDKEEQSKKKKSSGKKRRGVFDK